VVSLWPKPRRRLRFALAAALALLVFPATAVAALLVFVRPPEVHERYVEAVTDEPPLLNPVLAPYTLAGQDVLPLVFAGLLRSDPTGRLEPDLAEGWETSNDGRTVTVRLRDGLLWHDGEPLDAEDVAFTVATVQSVDHQGSAELADLWRGVVVEVADRLTVRLSLPEPLVSFPEHLTLGLLPRHLLEQVSPAELSLHPFNRQPVGSGPYRVAEMSPERIRLERAEQYHGSAPRLREIELRFLPSRERAIAELLAGQVDGLGQVRPDEVGDLTDSGQLAVYSFPERSKTAMLALNFRTELFRERAVRLAVGRALDRDGVVRRALAGQAEPAVGPIPVQSWAFAPVAGAAGYDPLGAATLLEEAGWQVGPDGVRERDGRRLHFTLLAPDSPDRKAVATELAEQLGKLGASVRVQTLPADELTEEHLEPRDFEAALVGQWAMGGDPDVYPQWHSSQAARLGGNYAGFSDPDADRWLEVGRQQLGTEDRRNAYLHFQARWAEEQPSVMLYHPVYTFAVRKEIRGVRADPLPDSGWRLRDAVNWYRPVRPTPLQQLRATVVGWLGNWPPYVAGITFREDDSG
jgi:peptide/nickel transport system substrate-binding protein